jgi:hypothetical protein
MRFSLCAAFSVLAAAISAQPGPTYVPCLDTMALNSPIVFTGEIVEICGSVRCAATNNVVVRVDQHLKGDVSGTTQAAIDVSAPMLAEWKARGSRLLIFEDLPAAIGLNAVTGIAIDLSDPQLEILTADMRILRYPEQVVQAAQDAIARHPGVYRISVFARRVPTEPARVLGYDLEHVINVPVDADLERWATETLDTQAPPDRAEAVRALEALKRMGVTVSESLLKKQP